MSLTLTYYPFSSQRAARILMPGSFRDSVAILDEAGDDVTQALIDDKVLSFEWIHGWVSGTDARTRHSVTGAILAMSQSFNFGETPVFYVRVIDSQTQLPLTEAEVESITLTLLESTTVSNNIRYQTNREWVALDGWNAVELNPAEVIRDEPSSVLGVSFKPNVVFEPYTRDDYPFPATGQYRAIFRITPFSGNVIPVVIDFSLT